MKKVLSIVALCLIGILAGTIIVFSCVNRDYNIKLEAPDFIQVQIDSSSNTEIYSKDDVDADRKARYEKVMDLYNNSFKQKIMSGIFQGVLSTKAEIKREYKSISSILSSGTFVVFNYNDYQTLKLNGKNYEYKSGTVTEKNIQYKKIIVEVKDTNAISDIKIYVESKDNSDYSNYHYIVKAKQSDLYKYLQENFK